MSSLGNANKRAKVIRALERAGFVRNQGSKHLTMYHDDGRFTTIPNAKDLNINTLRLILKQCRIGEAEYLKLYRGK